MAVYTFINGVRKRIFSNKPCVYINGVKHHIGKCYTFINGTRKTIFDTWSLKNEQLFLQNSWLGLPFGTYQFVIRGAGGAGGETHNQDGEHNYGAHGIGGAGAKGDLRAETITLNSSKTLFLGIGTGGLTFANGGNGGASGTRGDRDNNGVTGGASVGAGGGGHASYILLDGVLHIAQGGGGGGAGGQRGIGGRYAGGSGAGGGGGYYEMNSNGEETAYNGKPGTGGARSGWTGLAGANGNTTTSGFNVIYAGNGGNGYRGTGGAGGIGGGASGGSGGGSKHGDDSGWKRPGGSGGGGAGGSLDASCGGNGSGSIGGDGTGGYNFHTTPTDVLTENTSYGVPYNYGMGGTTGQNGSQGFVLVKRIA